MQLNTAAININNINGKNSNKAEENEINFNTGQKKMKLKETNKIYSKIK